MTSLPDFLGVASLINSVIKAAASVCLGCGGVLEGEDSFNDEGLFPQAFLRGEGLTGAVCFWGILRRDGVGVTGALTGGGVGLEGECDVGKATASFALDGDGSGAEDRGVDPFNCNGEPLELATDEPTSSPTRRRFVSELEASPSDLLSFNMIRCDRDLDGPNAGEEYRFRERAALALPPPSQR
jgi:hypothetical protein